MDNKIKDVLHKIISKGETVLNKNGTATTTISNKDLVSCLANKKPDKNFKLFFDESGAFKTQEKGKIL